MTAGTGTAGALGNWLDLDLLERVVGRLRDGAGALGAAYASARPFPHVVIDDLFDAELLDRLVAEFPRAGARDWITYDTEHERKATSRGIGGLPPFSQLLCLWLNTSTVVDEIRRIVGVDDLVGDPMFFGAGLHEMGRGGWLEMHGDYTRHPVLRMTRRVNLLVYLNRDWDPAWGGDLELWDRPTPSCRKSFPPLFNRTVIFRTTPETYHGVPAPLQCPPQQSRKLLSVYYWSPVDEGEGIRWASTANVLLRARRRIGRLVTRVARSDDAPGRSGPA